MRRIDVPPTKAMIIINMTPRVWNQIRNACEKEKGKHKCSRKGDINRVEMRTKVDENT